MVEDEGRTLVRAGDLISWPKGVPNGHHLINESEEPCRFLCVGGGTRTWGEYSDIDMRFESDGSYRHKDGFAGMMGLNISNIFHVGYSYDYTTSRLNNFTKGTHEFLLGFVIGGYPDNCPRNVW